MNDFLYIYFFSLCVMSHNFYKELFLFKEWAMQFFNAFP